jgi:hypothetical protein
MPKTTSISVNEKTQYHAKKNSKWNKNQFLFLNLTFLRCGAALFHSPKLKCVFDAMHRINGSGFSIFLLFSLKKIKKYVHRIISRTYLLTEFVSTQYFCRNFQHLRIN